MKTMRFFLLVVLALVQTLGVFTACRDNGSGAGDATANSGGDPPIIDPSEMVSVDDLGDYTVIVPDIPSNVEKSVYREIRSKINDTYQVSVGINTDFVKRGDEIPTDTLEILIGKTNRKESVDALETLRNNDWCVGMVGNRIVILGATDPAMTEAVNWFYENCFTDDGFRVPGELFVYRAKYNYQEISVNGVSLKEFVIVTDGNSRTVAQAMQRALTFASGYTPEVSVTQPQNDNRINVKIEPSLNANEWKYYCEDGQVYIYGEDADALKAGYTYFIDKYVTYPDSPKIEDGISDGGVIETSSLVSFNLPTEYLEFESQSYVYDANTLWANFLEAKNELPKEVNVLESYDPEDYPMSMKNQIFVATDGNDNNPGTIEEPVATIQQALDLLSARGAFGGVVWLRGGVYTQTALVDADNAGFDASPLFICAYNDEDVVLNGYYSIKGSDFTAVTESDPLWDRINEEARGHILVADLGALGIDFTNITKIGSMQQEIPYVYVNDVVQQIATFPNDSPCWEEEYLDESGIDSSSRPITMIFNPKEVPLSEWTLTDDMWITGSLVFEWTRGNWRATEIDLERHAVVFENYGMWDRDEGMTWRPNWEWHFFNFIEILDKETEWYIDRETGRMYYYPTSDFNADAVIDILGDEREAAVSVKGTNHVVIKDISFYQMSGNGVKIASSNSSISTYVVVDSCKFERITSKGGVSATGLRVGVIHSEFIDCGVGLNGGGRTTLTPSNNFVQNCYLHGYQSVGGGIGFGGGVGDVLSHNLLVDCGFTMNSSNECVIEYNEVIGGPYGNLDTGYLYCPGKDLTNRGNHIRYNYFHDNRTCAAGIYFDIHASGQYVYGNVVTMRGPTGGNGKVVATSSENIIYNNIFGEANGLGGNSHMIYSADVSWIETYVGYPKQMEAEYRNRYQQYYRLVDMMIAAQERGGEEGFLPEIDPMNNDADYDVYVVMNFGYRWIKNNVFYNVYNPVGTNNNFAKEHLLHGEETNVIVDDADGLGFTDYRNDDYTLTEDSVIYDQIPEWEEIPFDKIGPTYEIEE